MGLESSTTNFTRMLGPFAGGFLFELAGLPGTLFVGLVLYLIAAFAIMPVVYTRARAKGEASIFFANIMEGLEYARTSRSIKAALAITIVLNLFGFSFISMVPVVGNTGAQAGFPTTVTTTQTRFRDDYKTII